MPPHCDTMDGPVVRAAKQALTAGDVDLILPWVPGEAEGELTAAFKKTMAVRALDAKAQELADYWFFETAVRLHRAGEGAPFTGIKPAGLDEGPVVPRVETAIAEDDTSALIAFLTGAVEEEIGKRFKEVRETHGYDPHDVPAARRYVHAFLGLTLYANNLHAFVRHGAVGEGHGH